MIHHDVARSAAKGDLRPLKAYAQQMGLQIVYLLLMLPNGGRHFAAFAGTREQVPPRWWGRHVLAVGVARPSGWPEVQMEYVDEELRRIRRGAWTEVAHSGVQYKVELRDGDDGWIVAEAPSVGAASQGRTREEALATIREAIAVASGD